jgi:hypothetical protein
MLPKSQFDKRKYDICIGLKIRDNICEIWGYCYPEDFVERFVKVATMEKELSELNDIEDLVKLIYE